VSYRDARQICGIRDMPVTSERNGVENEVGGAPTPSEPRLRPLHGPEVQAVSLDHIFGEPQLDRPRRSSRGRQSIQHAGKRL
jgi:hypothetical protein